VRTTPQFRGFLLLSAVLALGFVLWTWVRWRGEAPDREAWASIQADLGAQSGRIDSLRALLSVMENRVADSKREATSARERIGHWGRQAVAGRLPAAEHRRYLREIDRHDEAVSAHNFQLAEIQRVYAEYSALVDEHNVLVDSANQLQRRAVQEGVQLSDQER
jgi:hypothetical protein